MSEIILRVTIDMETYAVLERVTVAYAGPWAYCKESDAQKAAQAQQISMTKSFMEMYTQLFGVDSAITKALIPQLQAMAAKPEGFGAPEYAALQAAIVNTTGAQYSNAAKAEAAKFATSNEAGLPSGVEAQVQAELAGESSGQVAAQSSNLAIQNELVKQQQEQFALSELGGLTGMLGNQAIAGGGLTSGSNQASFNQATQVYNQGSLWKNILGGVVGAGLNFATGGLSNILGGGSFLKPAGAGSGSAAPPIVTSSGPSFGGLEV